MIWVIDGTRTEFDRYNFRMGLSKVSENGLASFSWHSRSKLFARWWVSKPVFIDFGPDFGIWRVLRFDPTQKRGVVAYTHKEKLVEWITNGTTDFSFNGGLGALKIRLRTGGSQRKTGGVRLKTGGMNLIVCSVRDKSGLITCCRLRVVTASLQQF